MNQAISQPTYKIAFPTTDRELYLESFTIRQKGYTHEYIYRLGIEELKKQIEKSQ